MLQFSIKGALRLLGSALLALIVTFIFGALSISGVQSLAAADFLLWVSFGLFSFGLLAVGMIYCPSATGGKSAVIAVCLLLVGGGGLEGRTKLSEWLHAKKAEQTMAETIPPVPQSLKPPLASTLKPEILRPETLPKISIQQNGKGNTANPGIIKGDVTGNGPCTVIQNGGSNNSASPICNPDPNAIVTLYFCQGNFITKDPKGALLGSFSAIQPGFNDDFKSMYQLGYTGRDAELLQACTKEIAEHPEWVTPLLFCAEATLKLGRVGESVEYLQKYQSNKSSIFSIDQSPCPIFEKNLKAVLNMP